MDGYFRVFGLSGSTYCVSVGIFNIFIGFRFLVHAEIVHVRNGGRAFVVLRPAAGGVVDLFVVVVVLPRFYAFGIPDVSPRAGGAGLDEPCWAARVRVGVAGHGPEPEPSGSGLDDEPRFAAWCAAARRDGL